MCLQALESNSSARQSVIPCDLPTIHPRSAAWHAPCFPLYGRGGAGVCKEIWKKRSWKCRRREAGRLVSSGASSKAWSPNATATDSRTGPSSSTSSRASTTGSETWWTSIGPPSGASGPIWRRACTSTGGQGTSTRGTVPSRRPRSSSAPMPTKARKTRRKARNERVLGGGGPSSRRSQPTRRVRRQWNPRGKGFYSSHSSAPSPSRTSRSNASRRSSAWARIISGRGSTP
jgi:hypothetical protein